MGRTVTTQANGFVFTRRHARMIAEELYELQKADRASGWDVDDMMTRKEAATRLKVSVSYLKSERGRQKYPYRVVNGKAMYSLRGIEAMIRHDGGL